MDATHQETIKNIIDELMAKMGFPASVEIRTLGDASDTLIYAIHVSVDQNLLIGQHGANLAALQHIVRALARKKTEEKLDITVDVNDYFFEKIALLKKEADKAIREVLESDISVALRPMLPYERKIIHSYLADNPDVTTESIGKGEDRKILVRPKPAQTEE